MMPVLDRVFSQLYILFLLIVSSPKLFHKINKLSWYEGYLADWYQTLGLVQNSHVLEIGSASGVFTEYLSRVGMDPVGLDQSDKMVALAKSQYPDLKFVVNKKPDLPFEDAKFDAVIGASLLNVVGDPCHMIRQASRVCKHGGQISFLLPHPDFTKLKRESIIKAMKLTGFSAAALTTWQAAARKISPEKVVEHFHSVGLKNPKVTHLFNGAIYCVTANLV